MTDEHKQYASTAAATLEAHILSVHSAKSEAEWWAQREIERLRAENEKLWAALKPITDIKAFTCIYEWTPLEALRDDEKVHVKLTGAQIKAMRAAAALKETGDE